MYFHLAYCRLYFQSENLNLYKFHIEELFKLAQKHNALWVMGYAHYWQARFSHITRSSGVVNDNLASLSAISKKLDQPILRAMTLDLRANIESAKGNNHLAIADYLEARKLFEEQGDVGAVARVVGNLVVLYSYTEEFNNALQFSLIAEKMEKEITPVNNRQLTVIFNNRAYIYGKTKKHNDELDAMLTAKKYSEKVGSLRLDAAMAINISDTYHKLKQYQLALDMADQGIAIARKIDSKYLIAVGQANRGASRVKTGIYEEGLSDIHFALKYFQSENLEPNVVGTLVMLADAYFEAGQHKEAYQWYKKYHDDFTKMQFDLRQEKIIHIQEQFEADKKQKEIEILKKGNHLEAALVRQREWERNIGVIIVLMGTLIMALLYNRYRLSRQLNLQLEQSNSVLYDQSHKDSLTNLFNRRYIEEYIEAIVPVDQDREIDRSYTVLLLDIDLFKLVNDTHGHDVGDSVLVELSRRLQVVTREYDVVSRWGGEEFLIITEHRPRHYGYRVAMRILEAVREKPFRTEAGELEITVSIGCCRVDSRTELKENWEEWVHIADQALYKAKEKGRDQCVCLESSSKQSK